MNCTGKTGADSLSGGGGNDTLESVDQWADVVTCGAGTDSATVDRHDVVAHNCEHITIEQPHGRAQPRSRDR
jgi:Ca2+-binding RTX toxin-like protein